MPAGEMASAAVQAAAPEPLVAITTSGFLKPRGPIIVDRASNQINLVHVPELSLLHEIQVPVDQSEARRPLSKHIRSRILGMALLQSAHPVHLQRRPPTPKQAKKLNPKAPTKVGPGGRSTLSGETRNVFTHPTKKTSPGRPSTEQRLHLNESNKQLLSSQKKGVQTGRGCLAPSSDEVAHRTTKNPNPWCDTGSGHALR